MQCNVSCHLRKIGWADTWQEDLGDANYPLKWQHSSRGIQTILIEPLRNEFFQEFVIEICGMSILDSPWCDCFLDNPDYLAYSASTGSMAS